MTAPALSVLLPVYNGERYLAKAIESILAQTFADFEFIIVNDGSRDGSGAIIDGYAAHDARIRVFHQDNRGLVDTLNRGIALARAPLIARMDADDISLPRRFELQVSRFENRPDLAVVGGFIVLIDDAGTPIRRGDYPTGGAELLRLLEFDSPLAHPAVVMRRDVVSSLGGYRPQYKHAEDYDLWLRVHDAGYALENVAVPVLHYRQHAEKVSFRHSQQQMLTALVARLAHRARAAGLVDPTDDIAAIDETTIRLFPLALRGDVDAEMFVRKHNMLSLADLPTIEQALRDYAELPVEARQDPCLAHFLMRAARGLWAQRRRGGALGLLARALVQHPTIVLQLLHGKLRRAGASAISGGGR
ncbi:glycosyltransferase [Chelatococcus sp. XZ-Ab1]|uniref:glycosyltransferase family 2 protein n=1 Tax=Chelatococcus sp. XZ-Ab1 TaxID=3034027 RepID=UPI0023E39124|nr:glycosyltransferase [Chelatococcus sp. XZ-Ab1]